MKFRSSKWLLAGALLTGLLSGCASTGNEGKASTTPASTPTAAAIETQTAVNVVPSPNFEPFGKYEEPVTFTMGLTKGDYSKLPQGDTPVDNVFTRFILNKVNVKVEPAWEIDASAYQQKVAISLAGGDIPDVLVVDQKTLNQLVESDLIADLSKIYEQTASPLLKEQYASYNGRIMNAATFDGKLMALPGTQVGGQHNLLWVRQDWLNKLQLQPPQTLTDVVGIAQAFISQDPDGNNKADTLGLLADPGIAGYYNTFHGLDTIFSLYGAYPRQWIKDQSGHVIYGSTAPEMKAALTEVSKLYKDGIIDKQFAVRKPGEDAGAIIASGKVGLVFGPWWGPYWPLSDALKNDPKADWKPFLAPLDENGKLRVYTQNPNNLFLVVSKKFAHPEAAIKFLNVQNQARYGLDPDALDMILKNQGTDGYWPIQLQVDYEDAVHRTYTSLKEAIDTGSDANLRHDFKAMYEAYKKNLENPGADPTVWAEATARYDGEALTFSDGLTKVDPVFFGRTATMETKWATLEKLENETLIKIVIGDMPVEKFDDFVQQWNKLGGNEITQEVAAAAAQ
ncbi:extracellular solute-binding protein [Cohnella silvisoli]|uniref:Extracellular solute-binding protein n=1 Tax=Cohnella silvisoli TaxID=2873699 RepID=A0ABV1L236_9BACL|nr:extracellular solute-binding protein [Cohnella silvisoli]MCD9025700.1 extracellular solute-binding protein [Cohnella silvisoli]